MADVKITTPDKKIPPMPSPVEGKDYFTHPEPPIQGDLILRDGKCFMQYVVEVPKSPDQVEPQPVETDVQILNKKLDKIIAKIGA